MNDAFTLTPGSVALRFGAGALDQLSEAIISLGRTRAFVVTDQGVVAAGVLSKVTRLLEEAGFAYGVFAEVKPNPNVTLIDQAASQAKDFSDAVIIALGGGSSLDAAKGIALVAANPTFSSSYFNYTHTPDHPALPIIAIPTTAGTGSETNGWGVIDDPALKCKFYLGDASTTPAVAILDPLLTLTLPPRPTASTGIDALTHAIESLTSRGRSPISAAYAHEAIRLISTSLAISVRQGNDVEARGNMLLGAHLAGLALTLSGLGLVHGIAHSVSAHVGAAHGEALAAVLPEVMTFNSSVAADIYASVAVDMGYLTNANAATAIDKVRGLADDVNIRFPLTQFGVTRENVTNISEGALADSVTSNNPITPTLAEIESIVTARL